MMCLGASPTAASARFAVYGGLDALKAYVTQQQMWDPSADDREMITEFLAAYYEEGAPFVRLYMDIMHGAIADKGY